MGEEKRAGAQERGAQFPILLFNFLLARVPFGRVEEGFIGMPSGDLWSRMVSVVP